jgi:hypothetical protein
MSRDSGYFEKSSKRELAAGKEDSAGLGFGFLANLKWFIAEQRKILSFDEGVFIFMLSLALVLDVLIPMLWVFAISQLYLGLSRSWQRGVQIGSNQKVSVDK